MGSQVHPTVFDLRAMAQRLRRVADDMQPTHYRAKILQAADDLDAQADHKAAEPAQAELRNIRPFHDLGSLSAMDVPQPLNIVPQANRDITELAIEIPSATLKTRK